MVTFFGFASVIMFTLFIIYWVIISVIITSYLVYKYRKSKLKFILLDTKAKQKAFEAETGYKPTNDGKFTYKYKMWLLQMEEENSALESKSYRSINSPQVNPGESKKHVCPYCGGEFD